MATLELVDKKGKASGNLEVADAVFAIEPNDHLIYLATIRQLANARRGTAHTLTRSEVRGGGAKPWRQKGTGRARAGSSRSPLWAGGGIIHGPRKNVNWTKGMNKKERAKALISVLSKRKADTIAIKDLEVKEGKTKELSTLLKAMGLDTTVTLLVVNSAEANLDLIKRAGANLVHLRIITEKELNAKDLLKAKKIIITEAAAKTIENRFTAVEEVKA